MPSREATTAREDRRTEEESAHTGAEGRAARADESGEACVGFEEQPIDVDVDQRKSLCGAERREQHGDRGDRDSGMATLLHAADKREAAQDEEERRIEAQRRPGISEAEQIGQAQQPGDHHCRAERRRQRRGDESPPFSRRVASIRRHAAEISEVTARSSELTGAAWKAAPPRAPECC